MRGLVAGALALGALPGCMVGGDSAACLGGARLLRDGSCDSKIAPLHRMPFRAGYTSKITQGYHGYHSHKEDQAYSIDFGCQEGDPIVASRDGRVWDTKEDSSSGCPEEACVSQANYVILDHGDGTFSEYYHLQHLGALVRPGQTVCAGQLLGLCGNTGFSTGAHLHFDLADVTRQTIPVRFEEMQEGGALGLAIPDSEYTSSNTRRATCRPIPPTRLSRYAFAHQGVTLDAKTPMTVLPGDERVRLSGRYDGTHPNVTIHYKRISGGDWKEECVALDGGRFDVNFDWKSGGGPGFYWFMITGSDDQCRSPGWSWSYKIKLVGEQSAPTQENDPRDEPKIGANTSRGGAVDPPGSLSYSRERGARLPRIPTTQDPDKGTQ